MNPHESNTEPLPAPTPMWYCLLISPGNGKYPFYVGLPDDRPRVLEIPPAWSPGQKMTDQEKPGASMEAFHFFGIE